MIQAYFFDLDDTLFDNKEQVKKPAHKKIVSELGVVHPNLRNLHVLGEEKETLAKKIIEEQVNTISSFSGIEELLSSIKEKKFLVTAGDEYLQNKKVDVLGVRKYFDEVIVTSNKTQVFKELLKKHNLSPNNVLVVGDKEDDELKVARNLSLQTFNVRPRIVSLGGGTGQPVLLEGIKEQARHISAVVTMADNGGSSGRLREDFGVLPPGDVRNCLIALSNSEKLFHNLFQHRFDKGELRGHNFGNLFLTALGNVTGSFEEAVLETSKVLNITGEVLPVTLSSSCLCAELEDESTVEGEENVRQLNKARIKNVFLKEQVTTTPQVLNAIRRANIIVLGPGSLYTSIIVNLLVDGVKEAIQQSNAKVVYVCNLFSEPGETKEFRGEEFVNEITKYLGKKPDVVVMNNASPSQDVLAKYKEEGKELVLPLSNALCGDLLKEQSLVWEEDEWLHHDAKKLADTIFSYWRRQIKTIH